MPVLSIRIVLDSFFLLIFYSEKFSTHVCRLPYSANVNLNLSIDSEAMRAKGIISYYCFSKIQLVGQNY